MKRKCHSKNRENDGWETYDFYHGIISKMSTESSRSFIGKYERSIYKWMTCLQRGHRDRIKQTPFELTKMSAEKPDGLAWSSHQKLCLLRNLRRTSTKKDMGMTWPCLYSYTMDLSNIENPSKCCWSDKRQDPTWRCWGSAPQCFFPVPGNCTQMLTMMLLRSPCASLIPFGLESYFQHPGCRCRPILGLLRLVIASTYEEGV